MTEQGENLQSESTQTRPKHDPTAPPIVESASGIPSTPERIIVIEPGKAPYVKAPDAYPCPEEMVRDLLKDRPNGTRIVIAQWLGNHFAADDGRERLSIHDTIMNDDYPTDT